MEAEKAICGTRTSAGFTQSGQAESPGTYAMPPGVRWAVTKRQFGSELARMESIGEVTVCGMETATTRFWQYNEFGWLTNKVNGLGQSVCGWPTTQTAM